VNKSNGLINQSYREREERQQHFCPQFKSHRKEAFFHWWKSLLQKPTLGVL